jgi:hypothetical protein
MSVLVLTNPVIKFGGTISTGIGGIDFSDHISSVTLSTVHDVLDVTPVKEGVIYKEVIAGVGTNSVSFNFYQDFDNNSVEEFFGGVPPYTVESNKVGTKVTCFIKPKDMAISASNPEYRFNVLVTEWTPLNGEAGALSTITVNWPVSGEIQKFIL